MRTFAIATTLAVLVGSPLAAAPGVNANLATARQANNIDLGCLKGDLRATKFPGGGYDEGGHERVIYNISRCTGGYIIGTNTDTWKSWRTDVHMDGVITGKDLDGNSWRFDPKAKMYTNLTTGRTCASTSLRHVCTQ